MFPERHNILLDEKKNNFAQSSRYFGFACNSTYIPKLFNNSNQECKLESKQVETVIPPLSQFNMD